MRERNNPMEKRTATPPAPAPFDTEIAPLRCRVYTNESFYETDTSMRVTAHAHLAFEFQFVNEGTMALSLEQGRFEIGAGGFCVIPPNTVHAQLPGHQGGVSKTCFFFRCAHARPDSDREATGLPQLLAALPFFTVPDHPIIPALLAAIETELQRRRTGHVVAVGSLFAQLLVEVIRSSPLQAAECRDDRQPQTSGNDSGDRERTIELFFSERFGSKLRESDLSAELFVSTRQLNRILHDMYGMSFRQKLLDTRMKEAQDLLRNSKRTVRDIAENVGYPFAEHFHADFKAYAGLTPAAFRKQYFST
ncbi:helix-turn-helix transcriptional regulator [Paenibacillus cymbidii]|uniref:helix-turn-helix transcriptional regulator n=1 Tax=Paenibacillus cymbidii TaxID=1639034 RepID=UPI0014368136|nr:AraC family transcriptional regulator [Paenibacillus cymbidii]